MMNMILRGISNWQQHIKDSYFIIFKNRAMTRLFVHQDLRWKFTNTEKQ